jgi:Flp pilus assembly protein TadB
LQAYYVTSNKEYASLFRFFDMSLKAGEEMSRSMAFLFALIGTALLVGIACAISFRSTAAVVLLTIAAVAFIGWGFVLKAKMRRKKDQNA